MDLIIKRLLKVTSPTQQIAMLKIHSVIKKQKTVTMNQMAKETGISKGSFFPVLDLLEVGGIITTYSRGCKGIQIEIKDDKSFDIIAAEIQRSGIDKIKMR